MMVLLPPACGAILALWFARRARGGLGEAALAAAVATGAFGLGLAETLSAFHALRTGPLAAGWMLLLVAAAGVVLAARRSGGVGAAREAGPTLERREKGLLAGIGLLGMAVAATAVFSAPNNWDSLTYHLPRVLHWVQNGALAHYPTHVIRQLSLPPGAEIAVANILLLSGSLRLSALVQTLAWVGCILAAALVARDLGAGRRGEILAAVFAGTLPMGLLQASSTQNDLVVSFWLLCFVHFALRAARAASSGALWVAVGASLGLALATKATAFLYAAPFAAGLLFVLWRRRRETAWRAVFVASLLAVVLNAGPWLRNLALFHTPLGGEHGAVNEAVTPGVLLSNLARNAALELTGPSPGWNTAVERAVRSVHAALGISAEDPRSTWKGAEFHVPARLTGAGPADADEALFSMLHEDQAANPLHLLLALAAAVLVVARPDLRRRPALVLYLAGVAAGLLLFCAVLKWQPWNARLLLPLFLLAAPVAGSALSTVRSGKWAAEMGAVLLVACVPWAVLNATRPLLGPESVLATPRLSQLFAGRPALGPPLEEAARAVAASGCRRIGLEIGPDDPEYLVWATLRAAGVRPERLEHVSVANRSAELSRHSPFAGFAPCAIVELAPPGIPRRGDEIFSREWAGGRVDVRRGP
jgi:hypothetical protein